MAKVTVEEQKETQIQEALEEPDIRKDRMKLTIKPPPPNHPWRKAWKMNVTKEKMVQK